MPRASLAGLLVVFAALTLGGCNMVMSTKPMFTAADAAGAPVLRPGLWVALDKDCKDFSPSDEPDQWPQCANGIRVGATNLYDPTDPNTPSAYVLASGDPRILQFYIDLSTLQPSETHPAPAWTYFYAAVRPRAHDGAGRITSAEFWFIQCGPPPPKGADGTVNMDDSATHKLLPGMTATKQGCSPKDQATVRAAAGPSKAWDDDHHVYHWLRDAVP
ncbi:MAG TPA: hypothetical protein VGL66_13135 [Caulobacteraceae bacterium]|jgi:hypothetical protein